VAVTENFDGYTRVMDPFFEASRQVAGAVDDPELRRGAELVVLSAQQANMFAIVGRDLLLAQLGGQSPDGLNTPAELSAVARGLSELLANEQEIAARATGIYGPFAEELFASADVQQISQLADQSVATGVVDIPTIVADTSGTDPENSSYTVFRRAVADTLSAKADEVQAAAEARQRRSVVLAAIALVVATVVMWLVSRSITRPLRSLTRQARGLADRRLPDTVIDILETPPGDDVRIPSFEPVAVKTRDEVADVADALNMVQETALALAVEQAVLRRNIADSFVNLGRRNQNLLGRQLDFITELEANETDPDALANLFRLDHLATRMRRNAESLLVLAGIEPPRQWAAPVRLTDVIRAALGEVEDYQRVIVRGVEPATVLGSAAADLAHLLAELIENALVFSPPDQTVDIRGRNRPARAAGGADGIAGYTLAIIDSGLGMPPADITAANRRLAGAESFTIAPSKYLGHYVAGNLAARHDIHVHLDNSPGNAITATIDIPTNLLTNDTPAAVTAPHGTRILAPTTRAPAPPTAAHRPTQAPHQPARTVPTDRGGRGPARPFPATAAQARRTQHSQDERTAGAGNGEAIGGHTTTGDLADTLSRYSTNLHGRPPRADGQPPAHPSPTAGSAFGFRDNWQGLAGPAGSAGNRLWSAPPSMPPQPEPPPRTWSPTLAPTGWSPPPPTTTASWPPASERVPPLAHRRGTTSGGLARRIEGAQLPTTEPVHIRGAPEPLPMRPGITPPAPTHEQRRTADDVYNFLSSFMAGLHRGLEEPSTDNPSDSQR
jgi:signal transduction histidine kinase